MELAELREHRVGVLMSGGLSCTAVGSWLVENGVECAAFVADIGQHNPFTPTALAELLERHGLRSQVVDLRTQMAEICLDLVRYQATYEGGYWNTTSASRATLVDGLADRLRAAGCTVLAHGCVGGGNDQARFARYTAALAPDLAVFAPWTNPWLLERFPGRQSMTDYLLERGFPVEFARFSGYSIDGNLGGFAHDSDELEHLTTPARIIEPVMMNWPQDAPDEAETCRIRFTEGRLVEINGEPVSPLHGILTANEIGGRNGVCLRSLVENRVNGTKCRGVYEAPGLEVLGQSLAALYQVTLDKAATDLMHVLSRQLGRAAYEGRWFDAGARAARAAADLLARNATGCVEVDLYKGNVTVSRLDLAGDVPGVDRQTRFGHGGLSWRAEPMASLASR
jgi:argininosuccinate synthase